MVADIEEGAPEDHGLMEFWYRSELARSPETIGWDEEAGLLLLLLVVVRTGGGPSESLGCCNASFFFAFGASLLGSSFGSPLGTIVGRLN